jgi:aspartyl protease
MVKHFVLVALIAGCGRPPTAMPITVTPHRELLVHVEMNGEPLVFQIDTGASKTSITPAARDRLQLTTELSTRGHGVGGPIDKVELASVYHVRLGDRQIHEIPVAVIDQVKARGSRLDGMLGQDVLAQYTSELDLRERRLTLHANDDRGWRTDDLVEVPYTTIEGGLIRIDVDLGDQPAAAILDLGSSRSIASWAAIGDHVASGIGSMIGADGHPVTVTGLRDVTIELGSVSLAPESVLVADLPVFDQLDIHDRPLMIIGVDALGSRKLVIAPREKRLYISRG